MPGHPNQKEITPRVRTTLIAVGILIVALLLLLAFVAGRHDNIRGSIAETPGNATTDNPSRN